MAIFFLNANLGDTQVFPFFSERVSQRPHRPHGPPHVVEKGFSLVVPFDFNRSPSTHFLHLLSAGTGRFSSPRRQSELSAPATCAFMSSHHGISSNTAPLHVQHSDRAPVCGLCEWAPFSLGCLPIRDNPLGCPGQGLLPAGSHTGREV